MGIIISKYHMSTFSATYKDKTTDATIHDYVIPTL